MTAARSTWRRRALIAALLVVAVGSLTREARVSAVELPAGFVQELIGFGFEYPTAMAMLPDGRILVAEKAGLVWVIQHGNVLPAPFADLRPRVNNFWDRGLTGMAIDPNFHSNNYVYFFYPYDVDGSDSPDTTTGRLTRVTANGSVMLAGSEVVILGSQATPCGGAPDRDCIPQDGSSEAAGHTVDNLQFAPDGTLFVSLGDSASWNFVDPLALRAQDVNQYPGKVLRLSLTECYSAPAPDCARGAAGNPHWTGTATDIASTVWARGLRNPFRMAINPLSGLPFVGDVGWADWEEINVGAAGANYGWPCYEGNGQQSGYAARPECQALYAQGSSAVQAPLIAYPHVGPGGSVVQGPFTPVTSGFPPEYHNGFFYADYAQDWIRFAEIDGSQNVVRDVAFVNQAGGPVDLHFGPDGHLYYVAIGAGEVRRIRPAASTGGSVIYLSDLPTSGTPVNGWGPFERDRSNGEDGANDGGPLTINGTVFLRGLGVHAHSELSFSVPSGCSSFTARIGVDDEVPSSLGTVQFEVWNGTTERLYQSPILTGADAAVPATVPLSGISTLRLIVTGTADGYDYDHANWADAKFSCGGDATPPEVSGVTATPGSTSATIAWTTDEPSTSQIEYGPTTSYGSSSALDSSLVTSHSVTLGGLTPGAAYHYRVKSGDAAGNVTTTGDFTFTTTAPSASTRYLSDLPTTGTVTNGWGPFERDRSNGETGAADGGPLRIDGVTYSKGLGVHALSDISFAVPAGCTTFLAHVGIDDEVPSTEGSVTFEVWNGTATRLYASPVMTGAAAAAAVNVPLDGVSTLRLRVTPGSSSAYDHADWADAKLSCSGGGNTAPVATIASPTSGDTFRVGQTVTLSGSATDAEDGDIPAPGLSWQVDLHHCPTGEGCHVHPFATYAGATASFATPDHADGSYLQVTLTATDSGGLTGTAARAVQPQTVTLTFQTNPSGLLLQYGGEPPAATPFQRTAMVGGSRTIHAPSPQDGRVFSAWSDGGAQQHNVTVPATSATYTATFEAPSSTTVYLSDLPTTGTVTNGWGPFERDRSNGEAGAADGGPLRIDGVTYPKGLGVHALSDISFAVPAGCTTFHASVGVDDEVPSPEGSVTFEVWNGTATRLYTSPVMTGAMAAAAVTVPLDGVSTLRLRVTPGATNYYDHADWADARLSCGNGEGPAGGFGPPASWSMGPNAHSVAIVDMNGDGRQDLLTANAGNATISIRIGNGDGTFGPVSSHATGSEPKSAQAADLDGDGDVDVVTANQGTGTISVLLNDGTGVLGARTDYEGPAGAHEIAIADLDGDGDADIAAVGHGSSMMVVLRNTGFGTFAPKAEYAVGSIPHSVAIANLNGDAHLDIAVANLGSNSVSILLNSGTGTFATRTDVPVGSLPHSIRAGNLDGNAGMDLVVANQESNTVSVLLGDGSGGFAPHVEYATGTTPKGVLVADVDGDGTSDLLTANIRGNYPSLVNPGGDSISVLLGHGDGTFGAHTDYTVGQGPFSVAAGLLDSDARPDIATANWWDNNVTVRLNQP